MRTINRIAALLVTLAAVILCSASAFAHHGWASYDRSKPLTITGPVTAVTYVNPHVAIKLTVDGRKWFAILAPPSRMSSRGIPKGGIKVGDTVTVEGYPSRDKDGEMRAERLTLAGTAYDLR